MRQIGSRLRVDGDAENRLAAPTRLLRRMARVLDAETPFIMIEIVGLAVGDHQQQLARIGPLAESERGMAHGGAEARIKTRLERRDARVDLGAEGFVEILADIDENPLLAQRGKGVERDAIAAGLQTMRQRDQRLARHGDDRLAVDGALGGTRGIEQHRHGEVALLVARVAEQAFAALPAGETVGGGADQFIEVDLAAFALSRQHLASRTQSLELSPHRLNPFARVGV